MAEDKPPRVIGVDISSKPDETGITVRAEGFTRVCVLPRALGHVTKLKRVGNSVVCETASGVDFMVPSTRPTLTVSAPMLNLSNVSDPEKW